MVQRCQQPRLALEPREPIRIGRETRRQHFDRDVAAQLRVARAVDLAHAARTDEGDNPIGAEPRLGCE
jgi:hypothetical protein